MTELSIHLTFLEPYRMVRKDEENASRKERGQAFALAEKIDDNSYKPVVTGTLVRSAVIRAAEELLSISGNKYKCCGGRFDSSSQTAKPKQLRRRNTLIWKHDNSCTKDDYCAFCALLCEIVFHNLYLNRIPQSAPVEDFASERILNRVDYATGKAHDYFRVLEVDNSEFWSFKGKITIHNEKALPLLNDALSFVGKLCGAVCTIETNAQISQSASSKTNDIEKKASDAANKIAGLFKQANLDKLRTIADAVRALRLKEPSPDTLPKGKDEDGHFLWDRITDGNENIRSILENSLRDKEIEKDWKGFCGELGQQLYKKYKDQSGGIVDRGRMLGDAEYYSSNGKADKLIFIDAQQVKEWIFIGRLRAKTPFYFGTEAKSGEHTSFQILLDSSGGYRIPRSALRGVLRRDLRFAYQTGCNVELGRSVPCACPVCQIMRGVTVMDAKSDYREPPEVRHRIRLNQYVGTVDEGALFDMEVGPEGVTFPFILRYRGNTLKNELKHVLHLWTQGMAFLSGSASTGKGIFSLENLQYFEWNLNNNLQAYLDNCGFRIFTETEDLKSALLSIDSIAEQKIQFSNTYTPTPQWIKVDYEIDVFSPLLTNDPIAALFDEENHDAVVFKKRVVGSDDPQYAFKGESIRGLFRTAFGRIHQHKEKHLFEIEHEDCTCSLCKIFGSEHEAGRIRFEDLSIENAKEKHFDHVAIDRFTGGAADKKKFDDLSLVAYNPAKPITLKGAFYLRHDITDDEKNMIMDALWDIKDGIYPLGAKGGIGYGWVSDVRLTRVSDTSAEDIIKRVNEKAPDEQNAQSIADTEKTTEEGTASISSLEKNVIYNPHYFLNPASKVPRSKELLTSHHKLDENLITGRLRCSLKTLTPLIIPDTEDNDAFGLQKEFPGHNNFKFFRINDKIMIPGSEIRGVISTVFEAMTNSCFRVFEEKRYLSRRMNPDERDENNKRILDKFRAGRVCINDGKVFVEEVKKDYRLPLYDEESVTKAINANDYNVHNPDPNRRNNRVKNANVKIAGLAEKNRTYLKKLMINEPEKFSDVLAGKAKIKFKVWKNIYDKDLLVELIDNGQDGEGYIKLTGLNMVNIENKKNEPDSNYDNKWDLFCLNITLNTLPDNLDKRFRVSQKHPYPRPFLLFLKNEKQYFIPKRCERVFHAPDRSAKRYQVPYRVQNQYRAILEDYKKNFDHIDEKFRTLLENCELRDGTLVYFLPNDSTKTTEAITPVRISRKTDSRPLARRLPHESNNLRSCERDFLDEDGVNPSDDFPLKNLFRLHPDGLCPACRLFGTTHYKGRVRFGFAELQGNPEWLIQDDKGMLTLPLLEQPRPTWSMPDNNSQVPGRKFYVHHSGWLKVVKKSADEKKTGNNRTVEPLHLGNEFKFDIYFENLHVWELGLLLYCLELEDGLAHKMGMAKAHGFGSVKIQVKDISVRKSAGKRENETAGKEEFKYAGFEKMACAEWFGADWRNLPHVKNLLFDEKALLKFQNEGIKVRYPELEEYNKLRDGSREYLKTPWTQWDSYIALENNENSNGERNSPLRGQDQSDTHSRANNSLAVATPKINGVIKKWFSDAGYGYLRLDDTNDAKFSRRDILKNNQTVAEGKKVLCRITDNPGGKCKLKAYDIEILD